MGRPEKIRLGEILVQQKLLTEEQLKAALDEQKKTGRRLGRVFIERGELDIAVQTLARSAEYAGNSADFSGFYAGLLQRQKKHAEAVDFFDRALRLRPNSGVWLLGMGMSLEALGRNAEAQEAFRRAKSSGNLTPELQSYADQRLR